MPMTCQINMLRDRGRYVVVAGRAHQSLEPSKQMCFDTRRHATSVSSQTSTPVSLRSHTPTNRLTRAQIRGSLRNYWMIVSPREAPERSSMKPRPPCPWQRRIIMSLVVRARARVDCSACPRAAGQSNMIWNNAWTTGSLINARGPTRFCILAELYDKYSTKMLIFHSKTKRIRIPSSDPQRKWKQKVGGVLIRVNLLILF